MKLIKKIAAIMFAFMMVFSLSTNVKAESGEQNTKKGTITISNAIEGQEYKIYKILNLESYSYDTDPKDGAYSYTLTNDGWKKFFETGDGKNYVAVENDYVKWNSTDTDAANLAKAAIAFAKEETNGVTSLDLTPSITKRNSDGTVELTYTDLDLGYYLVDSSVGALCGLDTTNSKVDIKEKNKQPTVTKKILENNQEKDSNTASVGDVITYQMHVVIPVGTEKCTLHDKMTGLEFNGNKYDQNSKIYLYDGDTTFKEREHYNFKQTTDGFTVEFTEKYLKSTTKERHVIISYNAILTKGALMGNDGTANTNDAWLTYGDKNTVSTHSTTNTYTFKFPVYKYTGVLNNTDTPLSGAEFKLYSDSTCKKEIPLAETDTKNNYRKYIDGDTQANIVTDATGRFTISGLAEDTYYLKETKAPNGYNILKGPIAVKLERGADGAPFMSIYQDGTKTETINVQNNKGSLLPQTGGMGTTLIYLIGGALVLGSGIVLMNKKRAKAK